MTAVIYARYSSDNQREESIEGQIRECTAYAEKNDITIVKHYIDRAISAKTDNRPQFQQMIKDSDKKLFDIVLVWKLDRFARNRYDSARYKTQLKKNGVKLMSATEIISEGPEGIILESVLEGYAEYYSADLAEKVVRGQTENILKGRCNGGRGTFGYTLDSERKFHIDPLASPFVLESFTKYRDGLTMKEIRDWLNENGIKNPVGGEFTYNSVEHMLKNRRYIGELKFRDVVVPDAIPPIVPLELFDDVQEKIAKNKKAPARRKAEDDYLLTTKLHCGCCGALMFGESGTSRTGEVHRYYKCATAKKKKGCKKKTVRKQWLEDLVVNQTMQLVRDDAAMESIIAKVMELQDRENTNLPLYEKQLRDAESGIQNMLNAIQAGILTSSTKERLEQLEETKRELEARIAEEKLAKPKIKEEFIRFWLMRFRKLDMSLKDQRQALVDTFINSIYLYDDKVLITFNYKEGTQTITFEEAAQAASKENGSDLDCFTAPENAVKSKDFMAFLFCKPWLHGFCTVFARSVLSMSDDVGRCIALQSVPFFASGEQCQAELCLHFRVGILEQFQKSRHGDGGFACGGYSLRAGGVGLGIEAAFKLLAQLHTGGLLDMGVGVHQHIRTGVSCGPLHRLDVTAGDHQLVGGTGVPQTVKDDAGELRVCVLPFQKLFADEHRLHRQTVGETQQHSAVAVPLRVEGFFPFQPFQPLLQFLPQGGGHEDGAAGGFGLGVFQDEGGLAALQLVREDAEDAALVHLCQRVLLHPLHGTVDREGAHAVGGIKVDVLRGQTCHLPFPQRTHQRQVHRQMQDRVLHAVQRCPHLVHLPDAALLGWKALPFVAALAVLVLIGVLFFNFLLQFTIAVVMIRAGKECAKSILHKAAMRFLHGGGRHIMYVDWEYYKIFYYVAKYQNFTKAARVLGNNQPNITHSMNRLESQLNCVLFIRSNRGVTLTPEGEMLYSRIASAAVQIQDAEEELSASATLEHGTISISATETALNIYLSKKLRDFHTEYPGIRLRISNHSTPQAVQAVKNGEVDFAIVSTPAEIESGLKIVELKPFYEVLVGGRTFTALASQSLTLKELRSYPLISLSDESVTRSLYRQFFLDHGAVLKPDTEAATTDQMLTLVKSELGLAFVPEPMARDGLERGELVQLHLQEIIPTRSICLVYDRHRPLNTAARKFQQMLTKADPPRPAESKQTESISFVSQ